MRAPFVLPRNSDQFPFAVGQRSGIPCMIGISAGGWRANTRFRNGCKRRDSRVPDSVTKS